MNKKYLVGSICIVVYLFLISSGLCSDRKVDKNVIAKVNGENILESELSFYIDKYGETSDEFKGEAGKRKILDKLIEFKIMLALSKKYGEEENPVFLMTYDNYLMRTYSELFKRHMAQKATVTKDEILLVYLKRINLGPKKTEEEVAKEKNEIAKMLVLKKYDKIISDTIEKKEKSSKIVIHKEILDKLDKGKAVEPDTIMFEVGDEKISYERLSTLIPGSVRHSPKKSRQNKEFLERLIEQQIQEFVFASEAKRLNLGASNVYLHSTNKEYYEKLLVNMLDYNKDFNNVVYGEIKASDKEIEDYYDDNKGLFTSHESVFEVFKFVFEKEVDAVAAHSEFKSSDNIREAAEKFSKKLIEKNWNIGYISKKAIRTMLSDEKYEPKAGDVFDVLKSGDNYIITVIDNEKKNVVKPLEGIKPLITQTIMRNKSEVLFEKYRDGLKAKAEILIDEVLLDKVSIE